MSTDQLKHGFIVRPGQDGSFIVHALTGSEHPPTWGFSSVDDLARWLQRFKPAPTEGSPEHTQQLKERLQRKQEERKANGSDEPIPLPGASSSRTARRVPFFHRND